MARPLPAPRTPPRARRHGDGELRIVSLEDEAREELGLGPAGSPASNGSLALESRSPGSAEHALDPAVLDPGASRQDKLAALRAHLDRVAPAPTLRSSPPLSTGLDALDALIGGWPRGALSEVQGQQGTGRLALLLPIVQALTHGRPGRPPRHVAVVDSLGLLHPPGLAGVDLDHLLLVRPGSRALWAAEQLARAGALPLVLLLDPPPMGRAARRLQHAAEAGDCALVLLHDGSERRLPSAVRLEARGDRSFRVARGGPPDAPPVRLPPP